MHVSDLSQDNKKEIYDETTLYYNFIISYCNSGLC